jgi:hypothetical protein
MLRSRRLKSFAASSTRSHAPEFQNVVPSGLWAARDGLKTKFANSKPAEMKGIASDRGGDRIRNARMAVEAQAVKACSSVNPTDHFLVLAN